MRKILAAACLAALPIAATADDISYSHIPGGLVQADIEGAGDGTGFLIGGSIKFADRLFGVVEVQRIDIGPGDVEVETATVGLGGRSIPAERQG
jgi:hypothetical protein